MLELSILKAPAQRAGIMFVIPLGPAAELDYIKKAQPNAFGVLAPMRLTQESIWGSTQEAEHCIPKRQQRHALEGVGPVQHAGGFVVSVNGLNGHPRLKPKECSTASSLAQI